MLCSVATEGKQKTYRGMASKDAQMSWRGKTASLEGIATTIPFKGTVVDILDDLERGIRSGLSYSGARSHYRTTSKGSVYSPDCERTD